MACKPSNPFGGGNRLTRLTAITLIGAGALGLAGCGEKQVGAENSPTFSSAEQTPGATTPTETTTTEPTTVETEPVNEALIGVIDTTGLEPAAVEFAKSVTSEALQAMTPEERIAALTITPEMYNNNTQVLADLMFTQYASMVGFATNPELVRNSMDTNGWGNTDAYLAFAAELIDGVYGDGVAAYSEAATNRIAGTAYLTESVMRTRDFATDANKNAPDFTVIISTSGKPAEIIGGDVRNSAAGINMDITIRYPNDYGPLVNDPEIANTSGVLRDGAPKTEQGYLNFVSTMERSGIVAPQAIILS